MARFCFFFAFVKLFHLSLTFATGVSLLALFGVIFFGNIQIENNQNEKPSK